MNAITSVTTEFSESKSCDTKLSILSLGEHVLNRSSRQKKSDLQPPDLLAVENERHGLFGTEDVFVAIVRLLGRAGGIGVDFDATVQQDDHPVNGNGGAGVDCLFDPAIASQ